MDGNLVHPRASPLSALQRHPYRPALCAPLQRSSSGGEERVETTSVLTPHRVLSGLPQGPSFPSLGRFPRRVPGYQPPRLIWAGLEPSSDPAFVFSSQKNNRGSDGAKGLPGALRREEASSLRSGGALRGSAAGGGRPWKRRERKEGGGPRPQAD